MEIVFKIKKNGFLDQSQTNADGSAMSRSSFASFHLTGIKPSSGKLMTSSVDRLFENDGEPFVSGKFNEFNQVRRLTIW